MALMREQLVMGQQITDATTRFVDELAGVDPAAWTTRPTAEQWSLSEVLEHVTLANRNLVTRLDALEPMNTPSDVTDDEMPYLFYRGAEPPHVARPTGTWSDVDEAVELLRASANDLVTWADATRLDLRSNGFPHPVFGMFDGAQWLRFAAVHTLRHRAEIQAVRQSISI